MVMENVDAKSRWAMMMVLMVDDDNDANADDHEG